MDTMKTGAYLAMLRKARGQTQQEAAEQLGVSNKTISKWESGGGLPDITVLPALAELYGVTVDDILAGETLTERRRSLLEGETAARKKRLLVRLRTRFDVCLAISLALAGLAFLALPYVSLAALPLSVAAVWVGYILVSHPIRYGDAKADADLWRNLYQKLLAASAVQWSAFLARSHYGSQAMDWERGVVVWAYDDWKPVVFCAGLLALYAVFQWRLKRTAGAELLPGPWKMWLAWGFWAVCFLALWTLADGRYDQAMTPWINKYGMDAFQDSRFEHWPKLRAVRDAELLPYVWARRGALAAGTAAGLGLLGWTAHRWSRRKKPKDPLADPQK